MRCMARGLGCLACAAFSLTLAPPAVVAARPEKQLICHKPGEPNQRILEVGDGELPMHFAHGDFEVGAELCNGVDDDCDGVVDDEPTDLGLCTAGVGECAVDGDEVCEGAFVVCGAMPAQPPEPDIEISCDDGADNDCDALIDAADPDCSPCPTACVTAIAAWAAHDYTDHVIVTVTCGFDPLLSSGQILVRYSALFEPLHRDQLVVAHSFCSAEVAGGAPMGLGFAGAPACADLTDPGDRIRCVEALQRACVAIAVPTVEQVTGEACDVSPPD